MIKFKMQSFSILKLLLGFLLNKNTYNKYNKIAKSPIFIFKYRISIKHLINYALINKRNQLSDQSLQNKLLNLFIYNL